MKRHLILFTVLALAIILCLASAWAGTVWDEAFTAENICLEHISLIPVELSGFTVRSAGADAVSLSEKDVAELFENGIPLSLGPDGAVLWLENSGAEELSLFVQREREILKLSVEDPTITGYLRNCFSNQSSTRIYSLKKPAEWSADGRYISLLSQSSLIETPPFLLDTRTGEIAPIFPAEGPADFLTENNIKSCRADYGLMSADGRSLYLVMMLFGDEVKDDHGIFVDASPAITRYDPETGALSLVCRLEYMPGSNFSVIDAHHLLAGSGEKTLLITLDDSSAAADISSCNAGNGVWFWSVSNLSGLSMVTINDTNTASGFIAFSLLHDESPLQNDWYLQPKDTAPDGSWVRITAEKMNALLSEPSQSTDPNDSPAPREIDMYSRIYKMFPVGDTPYLLLMIPGATDPVMLWPDYWYSMPTPSFVLLNTETMESRVLPMDSIWTDTTRYNAIFSASDPVIRGDKLLLGGSVLRLNLNADSKAGAGSESDPELIRLDSAELGAELESVVYAGKYLLISKSSEDPLEYVLRSVTVNGYYVGAEITVLPESYRITVIFDRIATPMVPVALTMDRYGKIKDMLKGKDRKVIDSMYVKMTPERLDQQADREELLQAYPALKDQTLFILKSDARQDMLERAENILRNAGYTEADYRTDMAFAPGVTGDSDSYSSKGIRYQFRSNDDVQWRSGPVAGLLYLTDYLSGTLYTGYMNADPRPASTDSLPVTGTISFEYIPYEVTLDSVTEEGSSTVFTFTAIPAGKFGWLQR